MAKWNIPNTNYKAISKNGLDLIRQYEGLRLTAYMPTPNDKPTIGYGHTKTARMGMTIRVHEADELLKDDLKWVEDTVNIHVVTYINQNQYDALCSFVYNLGATNFRKSTLLRKLNNNDHSGAAKEFKRWNKQQGSVLRGLTKRRIAEATLFSKDPSTSLITALRRILSKKEC